uniref:Amino acid transporter transmembrane domain-containing protein n=1 Tax=Pyrodinium bahamense TaxID=73915 RepID=A0A7S0B5V3_9DINO
MGAVAMWTAWLITRCVEQAAKVVPEEERRGEPLGWPTIGQAVAGAYGKAGVKVVFLLVLWAGTLSYLVVNGGNLQILFPQVPLQWLIVFSGFVVFVTLHVPSKFLQYFSLLGIVATVMVAGSVVIAGLELPDTPDASDYQVLALGKVPQAASTILFCFVSHAVVPSIYTSMTESKRESFLTVSAVSFSIAGVVYLTVGVVAYYFFADFTLDNVAGNVGRDLDMHPIASCGFLRVVLSGILATKLQATFPLLCTPLLRAGEAALSIKGEDDAMLTRLVLRFCLVSFTTIVAVLLRDHMSDIVSLTGAICATSTAIIFPTAFYAKLYCQQLNVWQFLPLGIACSAGVFIMVTGAKSAIQGMI